MCWHRNGQTVPRTTKVQHQRNRPVTSTITQVALKKVLLRRDTVTDSTHHKQEQAEQETKARRLSPIMHMVLVRKSSLKCTDHRHQAKLPTTPSTITIRQEAVPTNNIWRKQIDLDQIHHSEVGRTIMIQQATRTINIHEVSQRRHQLLKSMHQVALGRPHPPIVLVLILVRQLPRRAR